MEFNRRIEMIYRAGTYAQRNSGGVTTVIPGSVSYPWDNETEMTGTLGGILPTTNSFLGWGNRYADTSVVVVPANTPFTMTFKYDYIPTETDGWCFFGLSNIPTHYVTIGHAFYVENGGGYPNRLYVYEGGTKKKDGFNNSYVFGSVMTIERNVDGTWDYYQGGTLFYHSTTIDQSSMKLDIASLQNLGVKDVEITY